MEDLKNIIKELKGYKEIKPSDDIILDCAVRIFISQSINESKDKRVKEMKESVLQEKATEKQLAYLEKLGYEGKTDKLSKEEAKVLIKEMLENGKNHY